MAIVVESVSTGKQGAGAFNISTPSGLEVGDLMVAVVGGIVAPDLPAGWALRTSIGNCKVMSKVADSSDISAGSVQFYATAQGMQGVIYRLTGYAPTTTGWYAQTGTDNITDNGGTSTLSTACSITPLIPGAFVLVVGHTSEGDNDYASYSGYTITTAGTVPTFTERYDDDNGKALSFARTSIGIADAIYESDDEITNFSIIATETTATTINGYHLILVINPQQDASGSAALLTTTPVFFTETVSVGTTGTTALLETTPTVNDASGATKHPTRWTNEEKPSTTWTNEDKL